MYVIDAWSFLAWFQDERPAAEDFEEILEQSDRRRIVSIINAAEVYYLIAGRISQGAAESAREVIEKSPVEIVSVKDDLVWKATNLKARYPFSIADAFAGALALDRGATLVTGDNDFRYLQEGESLDLVMLERS